MRDLRAVAANLAADLPTSPQTRGCVRERSRTRQLHSAVTDHGPPGPRRRPRRSPANLATDLGTHPALERYPREPWPTDRRGPPRTRQQGPRRGPPPTLPPSWNNVTNAARRPSGTSFLIGSRPSFHSVMTAGDPLTRSPLASTGISRYAPGWPTARSNCVRDTSSGSTSGASPVTNTAHRPLLRRRWTQNATAPNVCASACTAVRSA